MTRASVDVFISGGGIAGLAAAAAFGQAGFSVVLADPAPPVDAAEADGSDLRSTAFLQPARDLFERTGLWEALAPHAMPLEILRAVDTVGWPPEVRETRDFRADDISDRPFGWNLPNWQTRHVLTGTIARMPNVELRMGTGFARLLTRDREAIVTLTDGTTLSARLVVAADGRDSPVREAAGIGVTVTRYGQKAIAFNVTHPHPHENVSTELYNQGGAFVLVPLPDLKGGPASAVVWMNDGRRSLDLMAMDEAAFSREATLRSCGVLGELTLASPRRLWPVVTQRAERSPRSAPPSWPRPRMSCRPSARRGSTPRSTTSWRSWTSRRRTRRTSEARRCSPPTRPTRERDIRTRAAVIDLFNRVCRSGEAPVQALRLAGMKAVHGIAPLRRAVMRAGLGTSQRT
jgi:2-octaprenyl-6-methoxyphenol hydroxylase